MSTPPHEAPKEQSDAKPEDLPPDQPGSAPKEQSDEKPEHFPRLDQAGSESPEAEAEGEEEEEGECGFCLFMKGGGCRDAFIDWEKCVQEAETNNEDLLEKCAQVTTALKQCMDAHSDYYEPILRAEKVAEEQAIIELEKEKQNSPPNEPQPQPPSSQRQK
ncbi:mitochondrial intermembrane space import and assembly protein [Spatholobus suberectus]|nr:mitochondrial intermembrane space import and assembly protein [Spatholobus suberectus]